MVNEALCDQADLSPLVDFITAELNRNLGLFLPLESIFHKKIHATSKLTAAPVFHTLVY